MIKLQRLVDVCLFSSYSEKDLKLLDELVTFHNKRYIELFNLHLKPKAHFLTHYVTIIKRLGPLRFLWCMRYEAKHKELKSYCKASFPRINICYSLAIKACLKLSCRFFENQTFHLITEVKETITKYSKLGQKPYFRQIRNKFRNVDNMDIGICKSLNFKGTLYKPGLFLVEKNLKTVCEIVEMLYFHNENVVLLACKSHELKYSQHLNAHEIIFHSEAQISLHDLTAFDHYPMCLYTLQSKKFCRPKII